jgi:hypothetical protein
VCAALSRGAIHILKRQTSTAPHFHFLRRRRIGVLGRLAGLVGVGDAARLASEKSFQYKQTNKQTTNEQKKKPKRKKYTTVQLEAIIRVHGSGKRRSDCYIRQCKCCVYVVAFSQSLCARNRSERIPMISLSIRRGGTANNEKNISKIKSQKKSPKKSISKKKKKEKRKKEIR